MTDRPTLANLREDLIRGGRVELLVASAQSGTTPNDKFTAMRNYRFSRRKARTPIYHGFNRTYVYTVPEMIVTFTVSATHDILDYLRVRGLATNGDIPIFKYAIKWTSVDGVTKYAKFNGQLDYDESSNTEGQPGWPVEIDCEIVVTDSVEPTFDNAL